MIEIFSFDFYFPHQGAATAFSTREYIHSREQVEETLFAAVRERLGGTCCETDCSTPGMTYWGLKKNEVFLVK